MELSPAIRAWIGRSAERQDVISPRLVEEFRATLAPHLAEGHGCPLGIFWCLAPDIVAASQFGRDGHPRLGLFLPELPLPRRMWAGGELEFLGPFVVGATVTKRSTIAAIEAKSGKSGDLYFVTMRHDYESGGSIRLRERQDIVYRAEAAGSGAGALGPERPDPPPGSRRVETSPTLLFRYSAMTFNGHRIHYDHPYATGVEGYAGLVVHGPLQATLLLNRAAELLDGIPESFSYRGLAPLICGAPFQVGVAPGEARDFLLQATSADGTVTMSATAR